MTPAVTRWLSTSIPAPRKTPSCPSGSCSCPPKASPRRNNTTSSRPSRKSLPPSSPPSPRAASKPSSTRPRAATTISTTRTGTGWDHAFKLGPRKSALANLPEDESRFPVATWLKRLLKPTPLDVTADWVTILLEPETWPGRLVAKSMGLLGRVVALHAGCPALVASWIGDAIERLCGQMVKVPEGARAVAAEDVEELTVACDLSGGYVTPEVVDFALRAEPEMRTSDRTPRQRP